MAGYSQNRLKGTRRVNGAIGAEMALNDSDFARVQNVMATDSESVKIIEGNVDPETVGTLLVDQAANQVERTYYLEWTTSLDEISKNGNKAKWSVAAGKEGIFQRMIGDSIESTCRATAEKADACSNLSKVALLEATSMTYKNDSPVDIGISMTGVSGSTVTRIGECYPIVIDAFTDSTSVCQSIHTPNALVRSRLMQKYGAWTRESLVESTIALPNDSQSVLVPINHPVIELMHANEEVLGINMSMVEPVASSVYCVSAPIVNKCIDELCNSVVNRLPFEDFGNFVAEIHRIDGREWNNADGVANVFSPTGQLSDAMMQKPFNVRAKVTLKFAFLDEQARANEN
jgi:hypothetical protein